MSSKRGQTAIEYLVTHGWALMVLVLVVAVLYSIGIFNPNRFVSEECVFPPGFTCDTEPRLHLYGGSENIQGTSNHVKYVMGTDLTNGLGYDILIVGYKITSTNFVTTDTFSCENKQGFSPSEPLDCLQGTVWPIQPSMTTIRAFLLNGETRTFNVAIAPSSSVTNKETQLKVGDVRAMYITFYYKNCNAGAWKRGEYAPNSLSYVESINSMTLCRDTIPDSDIHYLSGKIVARIGQEINTIVVYP